MTALALLSFVLLIIVFAIGATVGISSRRARAVRSDYHHWIVRLLCAVLATAALVAVGVGTWRGTGHELTSKRVLVTLPTKAPVPIPEAAKDNGNIDLGPCKLIGTVLLARKEQDQFLPLCGESLTFDWPPKADDSLTFSNKFEGGSYTVRMDLSGFVRWNPTEGIRTMNGISIQSKGLTWSSSSSGTTLNLDTLLETDFGTHGLTLDHAPLSVIPTTNNQELRLLMFLTRVDIDDPLRQIPASEWLRTDARNLHWKEPNPPSSRGVRFDPYAPPGIRMLVFLGPSVVLLLLAAAAGSALVARGRRAVAFTALLAGMVLYAGLLDAVVLQRRASIAADASQPEAVRACALESMHRGTFFHPGLAAARIREIAKDPTTSAFIRSLAEGR